MENKLTVGMVEELNKELERLETSLRYVVQHKDILISYKLVVEDRFIDNKYSCSVNITDEFTDLVRDFLKDKFNVTHTGFSNSIHTLLAN